MDFPSHLALPTAPPEAIRSNDSLPAHSAVLYDVQVILDPAFCGNFTFNGTSLVSGSTIRVSGGSYPVSVPNCGGFAFVDWSGRDGVTVSNNGSDLATAQVTRSGAVVAWYAASITILAQPPSYGRILPAPGFGGPFWQNGTVTYVQAGQWMWTALPSAWAHVGSWSASGAVAVAPGGLLALNRTSTEPFEWVWINGTGTVSVRFVLYPLVTFATSSAECPSGTFDGTAVASGTSYRLLQGTYNATAPDCSGNHFVRWESTGGVAITAAQSNPTTVTILNNGSLTAVYGADPTYPVLVQASPTGGGWVVWDGANESGSQEINAWAGDHTVAAISAPGYRFAGWSAAGNVTVSNGTAVVTGKGALSAQFDLTTVTASPTGAPHWIWLAGGLGIATLTAGVVLGVLRRRAKP